ncbi:MAG: metallophosphoesterase family protein [Pseudomonadales bacterium]|nr:metallophosphoesterase family protein [Pseudomonadales bacterium]
MYDETSRVAFILKSLVETLRLNEWAIKSTLDYKLVERNVVVNDLGLEFDGLRILHLSDLHIDAIPDQCEKLISLIKTIDFDLCVMTGDYKFQRCRNDNLCIDLLSNLVNHLKCVEGVLAIRGNHDTDEFMVKLSSLGVNVLQNHKVRITRNKAVLDFVGVEDSRASKSHYLFEAMHQVVATYPTVMLAHTPDLMESAEYLEVDLYLCGHTHGGQFCLPGSIPVINNTGSPRKYISGPWQYKSLQGYTSKGAGVTGLPLRVNCPPEVTVHVLRSG